MGMERAGVTFASLMSFGPAAAVETAQLRREPRLHVVLDGRDHRPRGLLAARRRRRRRPVARPRHRRARPPAAHADGRRHGRRHAAGARTPTATSCSASASRRRSSPRAGTACPTATARSPRPASTSPCVRECLTGEKVDFAGDFYQVKGFRLGVRLGERRPKIVIGALNPKMLALAGEVADGVLLNYLPASHVPWSVEQVRKGGDAAIYAYVHAGRVRARGRRRARPPRPLLLRRRRRLRPQLRAGRLRRRGRRDPRPPRRRRPRRRAGRRVATAWSTPST